MQLSNRFSKSGRMTISLIMYLLLAYFIYHVLRGDRGLFSYHRLSRELGEKEKILNALSEQKAILEHQTGLMNDSKVDYDLLDELARRNLGLMGQGEELLLLQAKDKDKND